MKKPQAGEVWTDCISGHPLLIERVEGERITVRYRDGQAREYCAATITHSYAYDPPSPRPLPHYSQERERDQQTEHRQRERSTRIARALDLAERLLRRSTAA